MTNILNPIVEEMRHLASQNVFGGQETGAAFPRLHHDLVQHYFKARKVEIDYTNEVVMIDLPIGDNYTQVNITCQPLEQFLCSCVKTDEKSLELYRELLLKFEKTEVA